MAKKLTAQEMIERANVWVMRQPQFLAYSGVIMIGDVRIEEDEAKCPTAYTDGYNVVYGRKFIDGMPEEQIRYVVLHETLHKMFQHTTVWRHLFKKNPILTNMAADYVVNGYIESAGSNGVARPDGVLWDQQLSDGTKDVQEVYKLLEKKYPQLAKMSGMFSGNGKPGDCKVPGVPGGFDEHGWEEAQNLTEDEKRERAERMDSAVRQGAVLAGHMNGDISREMGELMKVKTDYREILRRFFENSCAGEGDLSYRRPNRRMLQHDMIMPTEICETLPHVVIGIDTSGSIGGEILTNFMSNVVHLLKQVNPDKIDLLYWDTKVAGHETYERGEVDKLISSTKPAGGGGTSPACVSNWLKKNHVKPTCLVMLTDGYVDGWPEEVCPTVWVIYENQSANPPYGVTAHI